VPKSIKDIDETIGVPRVVGVDSEGNRHTSLPELNEVAFDPTKAPLDLTKDEKRRTTSLLLAIQAYDKLIIKDAEMYIAISRDTGRDPEMKIRPATINAIVEAAMNFDLFIRGAFEREVSDKSPLTGERTAE
jgi:hypothetical protein